MQTTHYDVGNFDDDMAQRIAEEGWDFEASEIEMTFSIFMNNARTHEVVEKLA